MTSVIFSGEIFREGNVYVGVCRELDVSSFGDGRDDARASLREAVETFLEGCELLGTLTDRAARVGVQAGGRCLATAQPDDGARSCDRAMSSLRRRIVPFHCRTLVRVFELDGFFDCWLMLVRRIHR